jgi:hypothetical protein
VIKFSQEQELGVPHKRKARQMANNILLVEDFDLEAQPASIDDLAFAADWLGSYETDDEETAQQLINAINFLEQQIGIKHRKMAVNEAKRNYAKEHGVKFSQVKLTKKVIA